MKTNFIKLVLLSVMMGLSGFASAQYSESQERTSDLDDERGANGGAARSQYYNFDDGTLQGWTTIDADGDGLTWVSSKTPGVYHNSGVNLEGSGHKSSAHYVISGSWANQTQQVLFPDNYLVSPQVTLSNGAFFSFWACAQDANHAAEHFGVSVSDNGTDWTLVQEWTLTAKEGGNVMNVGRDGNSRQGRWYNYTVDMSTYAGQKYIAIRHFNCSDQFILNVDDITINTEDIGLYYHYDNGVWKDAIRSTGGHFYWAVMFPAGSYQGDKVTKVALYDSDPFTGTVTIYNNGTTSPTNSVGSMSISGSGQQGFVEFEFQNPINIDASKNLWVVIYANSSQYPAAISDNTGDPNGRWIKLNNTWEDLSSLDQDGTWMLRVFIGDGVLNYHITASVDPSYGGSVTGAGTYQGGSSCTLTANPSSGYTFVEWTKNGVHVSDSRVYSFIVSENAHYVAHFASNGPSFTIEAFADPSEGGTVSGDGTYSQGTTCTLTATPNSGYRFVNWTMNGVQVSEEQAYSFTVTENAHYVAHFEAVVNNYVISVSADPVEGGSVTGGGTYAQGASCTLTATANTGYSFSNWTKNNTVVSNDPEFTFSVTENAQYVAHFSLMPASYTITVEANPAAGGTVNGGGTFAPGLSCTVTAVANDGYTFQSWTENGVVVYQQPEYTFPVDRNRMLIANFNATPYYVISASCSANGSIAPQGDIQVLAGTDQTFTITPDFGCLISKVLVDGVDYGPINTYTFSNVGANHTIYAMFSGWAVEESSSLGVRVYPNPVKDLLVVEGDGIAVIQIYDLLGNKMNELKVDNGLAILDLNNVSDGLYVVVVTLTNGKKCQQNILLSGNEK